MQKTPKFMAPNRIAHLILTCDNAQGLLREDSEQLPLTINKTTDNLLLGEGNPENPLYW